MAPDTGFVVGVDIGGTSLRLALAGMDGEILAKWKVSTEGIRDPQVVVRLIQEGVENLLQQNLLSRSLLRAIAAGAPGITDVDEGVVLATSYLMGWRDVPLRALLEASLGVPAAVENDVNMAALAESQIGAGRGIRDFCFSRHRHRDRRGHRAQRTPLPRDELVCGRDWVHVGSRDLGSAGGKGGAGSTRECCGRRRDQGAMAELVVRRRNPPSKRPGRHPDIRSSNCGR